MIADDVWSGLSGRCLLPTEKEKENRNANQGCPPWEFKVDFEPGGRRWVIVTLGSYIRKENKQSTLEALETYIVVFRLDVQQPLSNPGLRW